MNGIRSLRRQKKNLINSLLPLFENVLKSTLVEYYLKWIASVFPAVYQLLLRHQNWSSERIW